MVTSITVLTARTGTGGTYRAITDEHGETYLCYDKTLWHHLEAGNFFYAEYDVATRKDSKGSYNRIIGISKEEPKAKEVALKPSPGKATAETAPKALVEQEIEEERATRELAKRQGDAKNRAFALSYALVVAAQSTIGKELSSDNIIALAKKFAKYLDTGE